jgi:Na+/proline symporter
VAAFTAIDPARLRIFSDSESVLAQIDGWMIPILGSLVAQEAMSRMLSTKSPAVAKRACLTGAAIYFSVGLMPLIIGLTGYELAGDFGEGDAFLPSLALSIMPPVLYVIFLGALISAILSTIDSALLSVTALAGHNIINPFLPHMTEGQKVIFERGIVVAAGIFCYFVAVGGDSIFGLVELASSFGSGGLLICFMAGLFTKFGGPRTALATLAGGVILTLLTNYVWMMDAPYLTAVAGCAVIYTAGSALGRWTGPAKAYMKE